MGLNDSILKNFIGHQTAINQLGEDAVQRLVAYVLEMYEEIIKITSTYGSTALSKAKIRDLERQVKEQINESYKEAYEASNKYLAETAAIEQAYTIGTVNALMGAELASEYLTAEQLAAIAKNTAIEGAINRDWWAKQAEDVAFRFVQELNTGYAAGEGIDQIVRRVRGSWTGHKNQYWWKGKPKWYYEFKGGILDTSTRHAEALVRTGVLTISNQARWEILKKNADYCEGVQFVATLDYRTTPVCRGNDGKVWDFQMKPIGHSQPFPGVPPLHWNCRSTFVPMVKAWNKLPKDQREQIPEATRASMDGQVPASMDYDEWLKTRPEADQIKVLGQRKWQMWKEKKLDMSDLVDFKGRSLTLAELRERYGPFKFEAEVGLAWKSTKDLAVASRQIEDILGFEPDLPSGAKALKMADGFGQELTRVYKEYPSIYHALTDRDAFLDLKFDLTELDTKNIAHVVYDQYPDRTVGIMGFRKDVDWVFKENTKLTPSKTGNPRFHVGEIPDVGDYYRPSYSNTVRHEIGHLVQYNLCDDWTSTIWRKYKLDKDWIKVNISEYAASNQFEMFAECFSWYTAPNYGLKGYGRLPLDIEDYFVSKIGANPYIKSL